MSCKNVFCEMHCEGDICPNDVNFRCSLADDYDEHIEKVEKLRAELKEEREMVNWFIGKSSLLINCRDDVHCQMNKEAALKAGKG